MCVYVYVLSLSPSHWVCRCRTACLQLHEDAMRRMKEVMSSEKHQLLLQHSQQLTSLQ